MVEFSQKETYLLEDLQVQEKLCIEKYTRFEAQAKDIVLKNLFSSLKRCEQQHYDALGQLLEGTLPNADTEKEAGAEYEPTPTYTGRYSEADKGSDAFLCTDAISTEKYTSGAYDFNLYQFADPDVRHLLSDIQDEEQSHAEKLYRYKAANRMTRPV